MDGADYYDKVRGVGFEVRLDAYVKQLPRDPVRRNRIPEEEIICRCTKANSKYGQRIEAARCRTDYAGCCLCHHL